MSTLLFLAVLDVLFILLGGAAYFFVTRRQARIHLLVEHLAALARKHLPLSTGLRMIAKDTRGFLGTRLDHAAQLLEEGRSLGDALDSCRYSLPPVVRNMARMGEKTGNLAGFLEELARSYRRIIDFHYRTAYFFVYPVILSLFVFLSTQLFVATVTPSLIKIAEQLRLPANDTGWSAVTIASEAVLGASLALAMIVYLGGSSVYFGRSPFRWLKSLFDTAALWIPGVRRMIIDSSIRQFSLVVGMALKGGAALPEAARVAGDLELNSVLRRRIDRVVRGIEEGSDLGNLFRKARLPAELEWFIRAGGASGHLADSFLQAANYYETRTIFVGQLAVRAVVPLFVLLNGAIILLVWYLVFSPIRTVETLVIQMATR